MDCGDFWHVARSRDAAPRFRPIAPKPAVGGASSAEISPEIIPPAQTSKRVKRRYVRKDDKIPRRRKRSGGGSSPEQQKVETWVAVEHVTGTCSEESLGCTDEERLRRLEGDTCPGFVSDGCCRRVGWVNEAYRRMVGAAAEVEVRLSGVAGEVEGVSSFTCGVRVEYYDEEKKKCWKVMPCDVWRLDSGSFAWRLDVKAALSLGL